MTKLFEDVSALTNVSDVTLKKLLSVAKYCIAHAVHEGCCERADYTVIETGIGELHVKVVDDCIKYRFIPDKDLEKLILNSVKNNVSPIVSHIESGLQDKIDKVYEELL